MEDSMDFGTITDKFNDAVTFLQHFQYLIGIIATIFLANKKIINADFPAI